MTTLLWQLYDKQGRPIRDGGAAKLKAVVEGMLHGSSHVWIWRQSDNGVEVLVQKRSAAKINWPGRLDKSAGGHITYGEDPIGAVVRKARVELGLSLTPQQLQLAGVHHWEAQVDGADMVENDFQWVYITELADPRISIPTSEVEAVEWKQLATIQSELSTDGSAQQYVPYGQTYYLMISEAINRLVR